ncbi:MAG: Lrp/AsnC family transcriptional regulator [Betaproteobacteria bacterium]|nr:Lrp/AsnC family transcriptional regulator [Betaproteobacteria bacterium]
MRPADLHDCEFRLLNDWQRDFPLTSRPFARLGDALGLAEDEVIARLRDLAARGVVSRVGAVFRPHTLGWSTLAAVAVDEARVASVATAISAYPEVNHNYEREHRYNLWFVLAAPSRARVDAVLGEIGALAGCAALDLPMLEDFHIDLGFDLANGSRPRVHLDGAGAAASAQRLRAGLETDDHALAAALDDGLALVPRPYAALAARLGWREETVIARLERLLALGVLRRFGVVVRHRELGYTANAMVVWDIPDQRVGEVGRRLAGEPAVTLCYRRPRRDPDWRYNLFSMVHGRDRTAVLAEVARLRAGLSGEFDLADLACAPLFSLRRFKQCGTRHAPSAGARPLERAA